MDERLIELVRSYEELYNLGDKLYFDTVLKNKRWRDIAEKLNKTAEECKQRWESLRSQYRKICKLRETTTGQAAKKKKKWRYEDEMAFLLPHMKDKARVSSLLIDNEADEDEGETQAEDLTGGNEEEQDGTNNISAETVTTVPRQNIQTKKILPRKKLPESASSTLMNYILTQKELEKPKEVTKEKDSVDLFFDSIKATARTFSPIDFHTVKTRIFNIVSEMESKYLFSANVDIHQPHGTQSWHSTNNYPSTSGYNINRNNEGYSSSCSSYPQSSAPSTPIPTPLSSASSYYENFSPNTPI